MNDETQAALDLVQRTLEDISRMLGVPRVVDAALTRNGLIALVAAHPGIRVYRNRFVHTRTGTVIRVLGGPARATESAHKALALATQDKRRLEGETDD